jgi:hypothetical protein
MPNNTSDSHQPTISDDICWGVQAIAREIGRSKTETEYLIRSGMITVSRLGKKTLIASKRQLRRDLTQKSEASAA